jgi:hypothetical protein
MRKQTTVPNPTTNSHFAAAMSVGEPRQENEVVIVDEEKKFFAICPYHRLVLLRRHNQIKRREKMPSLFAHHASSLRLKLKDRIVTNIDTHKLSEEEAAENAFEAGENVVDAEFLADRFVLDEHDDVIDLIYHTGPKGSFHPQVDSRKDQQHLREHVLWRRLGPLVDGLIVNLQPQQIGHDGNEYQSLSIWSAIYAAICASSLNTLDPSISIQNRFYGTLRRQKESLQEVTSLSLFRDDIERLLRDLYGDRRQRDGRGVEGRVLYRGGVHAVGATRRLSRAS